MIRCSTFGGMDRHVIKTHRQNHNHHNHERASGAAKRRRERRLRQFLRHERLTVAMALADNLQEVDKRWRETRTMAHGHRRLSEPLVRGRES